MINIVYDSMPRDNLLNSACLELFEFIKRENIKPVILHVVEKYRDKLREITYIDTFTNLILRYDQMQGYNAEMDATLFSSEEDAPRKQINGGQRWQGLKEADAVEEEYFNTSDDEEDIADQQRRKGMEQAPNGAASPLFKLVDYPDDDDDIMMDTRSEPPRLQPSPIPDSPLSQENETPSDQYAPPTPASQNALRSPPERLSEKRRREEDDDDELNKLSSLSGSGSYKRRSSSSSISSFGSGSGSLRRRKNFFIAGKHSDVNANTSPVLNAGQGRISADNRSVGTAGPKKIAISLGAHKGNSIGEGNKEGAGENEAS
jgi:protein phosphatase-4 regulatory subunit 3